MQRPPLSRRSRHRTHALARVTAAAGVALMLAGLLACKGGDDANAATAATPARPVAVAANDTAASLPIAGVVTSPVPPPPDLAKLPADPPAASAPTAQSLAAAHAALESALAKASHCTATSECRSLAVGGKACGGPTGYEAYSTKSVDPATMTALAQREHDLALQEARESHRVSNCMMLGDPGARCEANKCVTGGPGGVNNPATR